MLGREAVLQAVLRVKLAVQPLLAPEIAQGSGILVDSGGAEYQIHGLWFGSLVAARG